MPETVAELGEFGLIEAVTARMPQGPDILLGPGDDAAVVSVPDGRVVATTDVLVEGRHFRRDWSSAYDVGRKTAAQCLADVCAMGARPTALLVGLSLPGELAAEWALQLADGLRDECEIAGASVAGGDVVSAASVTVSATALGSLDGRAPVTRAGARPGDVVAVRGRLGWSAAGYAVLSRGFRSPRVLVEAHLRPTPPYAAGPQAADAGATAMCDVSDGLVQDLGHIAEASGVGIEIDLSLVPVDEKLREISGALGEDPVRWVLTGGEDHALAACFSRDNQPGPGWNVIGAVVPGAGVSTPGMELPAGGFDHFR